MKANLVKAIAHKLELSTHATWNLDRMSERALVELKAKIPSPVSPFVEDRSKAWLKVWDLCIALGMKTEGLTGEQAVLNFINQIGKRTEEDIDRNWGGDKK